MPSKPKRKTAGHSRRWSTVVSVDGQTVWKGMLDLPFLLEDLERGASVLMPAGTDLKIGVAAEVLTKLVAEGYGALHARGIGGGESDVAPRWHAGMGTPSSLQVALAVLDFLVRIGGPTAVVRSVKD